MVIFPYPKPTKCYGDTAIRRAEKCVESVEKMRVLLNLQK